jgi:DNA-binding transcriptional LysR family regulator
MHDMSLLFAERFSVVIPAGHRLASSPKLDLRDLRDEIWVVGDSDDDPVEQAFREAAYLRGFAPITGPRTDDYRVVIEYVAAGLGVAIVPELALPLNAAEVTARDVDGLNLTRHVFLATTPTMDVSTRRIIAEGLADALSQIENQGNYEIADAGE